MRSLRAPGRPPIAHQLADSLESTLLRAEPTPAVPTRVPSRAPLDKPSRIIQRARVPAPPVVLQPPPAPRTTAAPFRPMLHQSRSHEPVAGTSRSAPAPAREPYANVYPVLPPPVNLPTPGPTPSTRTVSVAATVKGKERAVDLFDWTSTSASAAATRPRRSNPSSARTANSVLPTPPSLPVESYSPPRAPAPAPIPDTPAPPGAFTTTSHSRPRSPTKPLRNPSLPDLPDSTFAPSPKQLALSAIQDLAKDVAFDFGSPARRKPKPRKVDSEEDEYVEEKKAKPRKSTTTASARKRKVSQVAPDEDDDGTETATEPSPPKHPKRASKFPRLDSAHTSSTDEVVLRKKPARVASGASAAPPARTASRVPVAKAAPAVTVRRKARRVLGTNGGVLSDREEDGVPVVNLKRRRPA